MSQTLKYRYEYDEKNEVGKGGFAVVYRGQDTALIRSVAIKKLLLRKVEPEYRGIILKRFEREARILAKLDHPNIISVYDYFQENDDYYIVMQYANKGSCRTRTDESKNGLSIAEVVDVGIAMCEALAAVHGKGIIHRDVTPQNILFVSANSQDESIPKLTDFGLARDTTVSSITTLDQMPGTWAFMPPEALPGALAPDYKPDKKRDVYGLGATLYYALAKQPPYPAPRPFSRKDVPPWLNKVVFKALARAPEDRYSNMDEMLNDLKDKNLSRLRKLLVSILRTFRARPIITGGIISGIAIALVLIFSIRACGVTPPITATPSSTITISASPSGTAASTATITPSPTSSQTPAPSVTLTFTAVPSLTPTPTFTNTPTRRPTPTPTWTPSPTPTEKPVKPGGGKCPPDC